MLTTKFRPRFVPLIAMLFFLAAAGFLRAQTLTVLHAFVGSDGTQPFTGPTLDAGGNLYGTTEYGGDPTCDEGGPPGCGVAYRLRKAGSSWSLSVLHKFSGSLGHFPDGVGHVVLSPNGIPFTTELLGGVNSVGTVDELQPPGSVSSSTSPPWLYTVIHTFGNGLDGGPPLGLFTFDSTGNLVGAAAGGGLSGFGIIYKLTPNGGTWTESFLYNFLGGPDGWEPAGVALDPSGNIFGVTQAGGNQGCYQSDGCGTIYGLTFSNGRWTKTTLHVFEEATEGGDPASLVRDSSGNLFGITTEYAGGGYGAIWELSPSDGGWAFRILYTFLEQVDPYGGPFAMTVDARGNLYGVNNGGGAHAEGSLFELANTNGDFTYIDLYDFGSLPNGADGTFPRGPLAIDSAGRLYGTTQFGGRGGGTIFEFTP